MNARQMVVLYAFSLLILVSACSRGKGTEQAARKSLELESRAAKAIPGNLLVVDTATVNRAEQTQLEALEEHLFGRFFNDRAEFYVIKNPENKLFSSDVKSITMYYIDGVLGKTKYVLTTGISADLMANYGNFKIAGLDSMNKLLIRERQILMHGAGEPKLEPRLNHFEMSWQKKDKIFLYREIKNDSAHQFVFIEKLNDYDKRLRAIDVIF